MLSADQSTQSDAVPYDTCIFVVVTIIIVWLNRETLFTRKYSIIDGYPQRNRVQFRMIGASE